MHNELKEEYKKISNTPGETIATKGLLSPKLSELIKINDTASLNAVYEKIVAVESCHYVFEVCQKMQKHINVLFCRKIIEMHIITRKNQEIEWFLGNKFCCYCPNEGIYVFDASN